MRKHRPQFLACGLTALLMFSIAGCTENPESVTGPVEAPLLHTGDDGEEHSHGRFSSLTWAPVPGLANTVDFTFKIGLRRSFNYPCSAFTGSGWTTVACTGAGGGLGVNDIFIDNLGGAPSLNFGDGSSNPVRYRVTTVNLAEDWVFAEAVDHFTGQDKMRHTYPGTGPYLASSTKCCRLGGLNNFGSTYGVTASVDLSEGNASPVSNMIPVLSVAQGGVRNWTIPASDPDGDQLRFSLPNPSSVGLNGSQPIGMSINPSTGEVSWNTDGRALGLYFSTVMIEDLAPDGTPKSYVLVDYLVNLQVGTPNNAPTFTSPSFCGASTTFTAGTPGSFSVTASDVDAGDVVTLSGTGIPSGASFAPGAPGNPVSGTFNWTPTAAQEGPTIVTFSATDQSLAQALCNVTINVEVITNLPPEADAGGPYAGEEGSPVSFDGTGSTDPDGDPLTYSWDFGDGNSGVGATPSHTYADNGLYTVTLTVEDPDGASDMISTTAEIANVAPDVGVLTGLPSDPIPVGSSVSLGSDFTDPGILDTHNAVIDWGDGQSSPGSVDQGAGSGSVEGSHTYLEAGVYVVTATVLDNDGDSGQSTHEYVVVYDPDGGFVTGGGWTEVGAGSYSADLDASGPARFGFVSKYLRGRITPDGQTQFQFHAAGMNFHSVDYEWLVISGARAQYKGTGTINREAGYCFMMTAVDGQVNGGGGVDRLRLKIWDCASETIVFDNQMGDVDDAEPTAITRGSIVIHRR
jgi:PKD repeat protein